MKKILILLLVLAAGCSSNYVKFWGYVKDTQTAEPISKAMVAITQGPALLGKTEASDYYTFTNSKGYFYLKLSGEFAYFPNASIGIVVQKRGYEARRVFWQFCKERDLQTIYLYKREKKKAK